eukprot:SAG11_NODE_2050_length_3882_cov_13.229842_4_plen_193_part_00
MLRHPAFPKFEKCLAICSGLTADTLNYLTGGVCHTIHIDEDPEDEWEEMFTLLDDNDAGGADDNAFLSVAVKDTLDSGELKALGLVDGHACMPPCIKTFVVFHGCSTLSCWGAPRNFALNLLPSAPRLLARSENSLDRAAARLSPQSLGVFRVEGTVLRRLRRLDAGTQGRVRLLRGRGRCADCGKLLALDL